jgi:PEP-CTERM motif
MRLLARLLTAFAISALTCALSASAEEITYTYTGNQFNNFGGDATCPLECNISGSFTISAPLGPDFDGFFVPDSFSFTDGVVTITQANATSFAFGFITDSLGEITVWNVNAIDPLTSMFTSTGPSVICPVGCTVTDGSFAPSAVDTINYAQIINDPGTWSSVTTATPEPSTFVLLGTGILGLAGAVRRKFLLRT